MMDKEKFQARRDKGYFFDTTEQIGKHLEERDASFQPLPSCPLINQAKKRKRLKHFRVLTSVPRCPAPLSGLL